VPATARPATGVAPARDERAGLFAAVLAGAWIASLAGYVWFWTRPLWLPRWPLDTNALDPTATLGLTYAGLAHYIVGWALPMALYAVALIAAWKLGGRLGAGPVVAGAVTLALALWVTYPILAADVFDYLMIGRLVGHYHQNPYVHIATEHPEDPYFPPVGWPDLRSVYGPLFNGFMALPAGAARGNVLAALLIFKAFIIAAHGANTWIVHRLARERGADRPAFAALAYGWSPLAVIYFGVDGHNDALMILFIGLAALAALRERHELALPLVTAAALVKFVPAILLPAFLLAARPSPRRAAAGLMTSLVLAAAAFAPQWAGLDTFDGVRDQGSRQTSSLASVLTFALDSESAVRGLMIAAFTLGYAYVLLRVRGLPGQTFALLSLYLATVAFWFKGWYVTWPLMFGAAAGGPALAVAVVWSVGPLITPVFGAWGWLMYWWDWHRRWGIWMMETWLTASLLVPLAAGLLGVALWRLLTRQGASFRPT
jgi:hypothetical protein